MVLIGKVSFVGEVRKVNDKQVVTIQITERVGNQLPKIHNIDIWNDNTDFVHFASLGEGESICIAVGVSVGKNGQLKVYANSIVEDLSQLGA